MREDDYRSEKLPVSSSGTPANGLRSLPRLSVTTPEAQMGTKYSSLLDMKIVN